MNQSLVRLWLLGAALTAGSVAGCASVEHGRGFDDVRREVHARTGAEARWDSGSDEDAEARRAVRGLLAKELTAEAAVQVALLNNRDLRATYEELDIAQADLVRAGLLRNPVFSGEVRFATSGGGTGVGLDVAQDFLSLLWLPLRKARAGAAFEAAKARVAGAAVAVAFDAQNAFYEHQAAEEIRALRSHVEEAAAASHELAKRLRDAGNTRELDLLNEQALYERARLDTEKARVAAAQTRERLNVLMGVWGADTAWRAAPRLPAPPESDPPAQGAERRAVETSLELAEARAQVDAAAADARLARPLAWLEGSEIGVAAEREVEGGWSIGPSFAIPIPIFDLGKAAGGETAARLRQSADRYYAAAVRVRAQARERAALLASARERFTRLRDTVLPLHGRIVERTQLQYNAMQVSAFQLLQAKRDQIDVGVESVEVLRDYWTARAALLHATGGDRPAQERASPPSGRPQPSHGAHP